jgi:hypothetical protein
MKKVIHTTGQFQTHEYDPLTNTVITARRTLIPGFRDVL